ncbi:hypothetical protein ACROYT_G025485 [Oculina patagonica]
MKTTKIDPNVVEEKLANERAKMMTVLTDIEALINSQPLTYIGDDIRDGRVVTPGPLLAIGRDLQSPVLTTYPRKQKCPYQSVTGTNSDFWSCWLKEYLPSLTVRQKWTKEEIPLKERDVVLVSEDNVSRGKWKLGKVAETFPGKDGKIRTVKVLTEKGMINIPVQRLHLLEAHRDSVFSDRNSSVTTPIGREENNDDCCYDVRARIQEELDGPGCLLGYRSMWHTLRREGNQVSRKAVLTCLQEMDPEGSERRRRKLNRRVYTGPNHCWHINGYDKLKPDGLAIRGCIGDGVLVKEHWNSHYIRKSHHDIVKGRPNELFNLPSNCVVLRILLLLSVHSSVSTSQGITLPLKRAQMNTRSIFTMPFMLQDFQAPKPGGKL